MLEEYDLAFGNSFDPTAPRSKSPTQGSASTLRIVLNARMGNRRETKYYEHDRNTTFPLARREGQDPVL